MMSAGVHGGGCRSVGPHIGAQTVRLTRAFVMAQGLHGLRGMHGAVCRVGLLLGGRARDLLFRLAGPIPHVDGAPAVFT